eukprot:285958_1
MWDNWDLKLMYFVMGLRDTMFGRFFAIFLLDQNLSAYQIGFITGACCICYCVASPFWSFLADYYNRYMVLQIVLILSGILSLLLFLPHYIFDINNTNVLFPMLGVFIVLYNFPNQVHAPLMDTLTILKLGDKSDQYGKQRAGASTSWAIAHIILGVSLDFGLKIQYIVVLFFILTIPTCIVVYVSFHDMEQAQKDNKLMEIELMDINLVETNKDTVINDPDAKHLIEKPKVNDISDKVSAFETIKFIFRNKTNFGIFLVLFLWGGMLMCIESLLYVYIEQMSSKSGGHQPTYTYLGLAVAATIPSEMILLYLSGWFIENVGYRNMIHIGLFAYIIRVIGYTFITSNNLWLLLFTEPLHGFIFGLVQAATVALVNEMFPEKYAASAQGLRFGVRSGLGPFVFVILGGIALDYIGGKWMYRILAITSFSTMIILQLFSHGNAIFNAKKKNSESSENDE